MNGMQQHYDQVTEAWCYIMGKSSHYGYFASGSEDLDTASDQMIDQMLVYLNNKPANMHILDIGSGQGSPAFYLNKKLQAKITGISISPKEIEIATQRCIDKSMQNNIQFLQADAMDNKLKDESFDAIFMMETALLMHDKNKLFEENYRVLKKGGILVLCDQFKINLMSPSQMYRNGEKLETLIKTFGNTQTETVPFYTQALQDSGFTEIETRDITKESSNTPNHWKANCLNNKAKILEFVDKQKFEAFIASCDILNELREKQFIGYGIIKALKS